MAFKFELIRPDDLLHLFFEGENLRLEVKGGPAGEHSTGETLVGRSSPAGDDTGPALVPEDPSKDAYLIVTFPPQTVTEQAFFESSPVEPLPDEKNNPHNQPPGPPDPQVFPDPPARARIGRQSRLVFRLPAGSNPRLPFTFEGLLNWDNLELNVSALAGLPAEPSAEERRSAPGITEPGRLETAIELPYRLLLSPGRQVAWLHALQPKFRHGLAELWHTRLALRTEQGGVVEISRANPAPLRAIWSPDFNPDKFTASDTPEFGKPDSDWGILTPMTPSDRHEIVILTSGFRGFVRDKNDHRSYEPLPIYTEQLMLSALGGWLKSRGNWDPPAPYRSLLDIRIRPDLAVNGQKWERLLQEFQDLVQIRAGNPPPAPPGLAGRAGTPEEDNGPAILSLEQPRRTAPTLGGRADWFTGQLLSQESFRMEQAYTRLKSPLLPRPQREVDLIWEALKGETGARLNVSEWGHIASLGRDHYVRIVYEGHLYPFGHRASLVKVTERKIRMVSLQAGGSTPLAYLVQRMFIVVRQPFRDYSQPEIANHLENEGRGLPFRSIRLLTLVTPDIADPQGPSRLPVMDGSSFWVRLGSGSSPDEDLKFRLSGEDYAGNKVDFSASLVFVPFSEDKRAEVAEVYLKSGEARLCEVRGQKLAYKRDEPSDNTILTTQGLYFSTHTAPDDKIFGGFLPRLFKASVRLPAVEAILGREAAAEIKLSQKYLAAEAGNSTGLFAEIVKENTEGVLSTSKLAANFQADQAGGFATPDLSISGLTAQLGPLAGDLGKAASDVFEPADFFGEVANTALLFGSLKLSELLAPLSMTAGAPKVRITQEKLPPPNDDQTLMRAELDWTPQVKKADAGIVVFHPNRNGGEAKMAIHGRVEQVIAPAGGPPPPASSWMEGSLTDFKIELLNVVEVLFERFAFKSESGKKTEITVALDSGTPVRFIGDLNFVEELRKTIPPGLFGDGPSLDLNAERVKAGFSIGLPPVSVGVFSLREVVLAAFIELPFRDGKPLFDFSFSSRERPFNLTVTLFGGGGFFHLQIDTKGIKMLEAALEFGASASVDLGVASGSVYVMAGIYFSIQRQMIGGEEVDAATLAGYLRMGGELSVLGLISVSLEFYLVFAYESAKNAAYGRATLTVKVEVLFISKSVEVTVEKRFGGSAGDPYFIEAFDSVDEWDEYAGAFA